MKMRAKQMPSIGNFAMVGIIYLYLFKFGSVLCSGKQIGNEYLKTVIKCSSYKLNNCKK